MERYTVDRIPYRTAPHRTAPAPHGNFCFQFLKNWRGVVVTRKSQDPLCNFLKFEVEVAHISDRSVATFHAELLRIH